MNKNLATASVITAGVLWGLISIFIHNLTAFGFSTVQISFCRSFFSAVLLFLFLFVADRDALKIRPKDLWCFVGTGMISLSFFNFCYFTAIAKSQGSVAVALLYTSPVFVMLFSLVLFKEQMNFLKGLTLLFTLAGCFLVSGIFEASVRIPFPILIIGVASGLFYGLYSIFGRYALMRYRPITVTFYTFVFSFVGSAPFCQVPKIPSLLLGNRVSVLWLVGIAIISTILPYLFYTLGLKSMETGRAAVLVTVEPLVGAVIGIVLYREPHNFLKLIGMALILSSTILLNLPEPKAKTGKTATIQ